MTQPLWGIDLGGTKIEGAIVPSLDNPQPILRTRIDTEGHKGYEHIIGQIDQLVKTMKKQSGLQPARIGLGTPGVLDPILQTMKNCNSTALNGKALKKDLEEKLGIPCVLANDVFVSFMSFGIDAGPENGLRIIQRRNDSAFYFGSAQVNAPKWLRHVGS